MTSNVAPLGLISYDLKRRRFVRGDYPFVVREFTKTIGDRAYTAWHSQKKNRKRFVSVVVNDRNLTELEEFLTGLGDRRSAWRLRAMYPETFYYNHGPLPVSISNFLKKQLGLI